MDWDAIWNDPNKDVSFIGALCEYFEVDPDHPKVPLLFNLAWERGHSGGLCDVADEFGDMAELIK
jgi:hypothetical protein